MSATKTPAPPSDQRRKLTFMQSQNRKRNTAMYILLTILHYFHQKKTICYFRIHYGSAGRYTITRIDKSYSMYHTKMFDRLKGLWKWLIFLVAAHKNNKYSFSIFIYYMKINILSTQQYQRSNNQSKKFHYRKI